MKIDTEKIIKWFILLTIFSLPCYLCKFVIVGIPTNLTEILAFISVLLFLVHRKKSAFMEVYIILKPLALPLAFLFAGLLLSIAQEGSFSLHGLGIIKSWFFLPIIFSTISAIFFSKDRIIHRPFHALYVSISLTALISLSYKIAGITTFDGRLSSFYMSPNNLSMFLIFAIFIFPYLFLKNYSLFKKIFLLLSFSIILVSIYFTYSYAVWASAVISISITLFINRGLSKKLSVLVFLILVFLAFFFLQLNTAKFLGTFDTDSSFSSRIVIWKSASKIVSENLFFGIGPGNFQEKYLQYQKYFPPYPEWAVPHPHSVYLTFWLYSGVLGFLAFLEICRRTILNILKNKNAPWSACLLTGMLYILIHGFLDTTIWKNDLAYIFWIIIVFSISFGFIKNPNDKLIHPSCL